MPTVSPSPLPANGRRQLSAKESMQRARALACTLPASNRPDCSGHVYVGIFFDGTGNNMKLDHDELPPDKRKHSNIVKLFQAYPDRPTAGFFPFYIPGVGTPFPEIGDDNRYIGPNRGSVAAEHAEDRIIWAFTRLINAPFQYVYGNAQLIDDGQSRTIANTLASGTNPGAMRRLALKTWQDKLKAALKGQRPTVEMINLSVFGFSRGAAQSRAFVNWLFEVCTPEAGGWTFAGIPIRLQFLGLFDTVASVGLANLFDTGVLAGHQSWADNSLQIHPAVEQCVHYVAGHEVRACFPLDSVRVKAHYPPNAIEVMYPGAHSDVGGGYAPGDLGVSPDPQSSISIIPGADMYQAARRSGVPLHSWAQLDKHLQTALTPSPEVIKDYNAYLRTANVGVGPVEAMHRRHMSLYFSYRFKVRDSFFNRAPFTQASREHQDYLRATQNCLIVRLRALHQGDPMSADFDPPRAAVFHRRMVHGTVADRHLDEVAEQIDVLAVKPEIERFAERYIHDSMAGFIDMGMNEYAFNGIGIVKFRTTFKGND